MTGFEAVAALEGIGARLALRPDGLIDVQGPDVPDFDPLVDELRQHRDEAVALLRSRPGIVVTFDPERRKRAILRAFYSTCGTCGSCWWHFNERGDAWCIPCWRETRKNLAPSPEAARTATGPGSAIPPASVPRGGAA